jgi:ABC-2 type transport system permease protein
MQPFLTLVRRELGTYFVSPLGYVIIACIQLMLGCTLLILLVEFSSDKANTETILDVPLTEHFFNAGLFWLILLVTAPLITMRTFAHEKFSGTYETLMTAPVGDAQVVLAKFTGSMLFYLAAWAPVIGYPHLLRYYSYELPPVEPGVLASTFLGVFLFCALYTAIGCFASSLTRSQIIAAMTTFVIGLGMFLLSFLSLLIPAQPGWRSKFYSQISMIEHMRDFAHGVVDTRHLVFYASLIVFFLFLTVKVVESRRWK